MPKFIGSNTTRKPPSKSLTLPGIPSDRSGWCKFRDLIALRGQFASQVASVGTKLRVLPQSRDVRRVRTADHERRLVKPWTDNVN